jgi:hypothetical protein
MVEVAIIGAGQLGSRHLQALALLEGPVAITLVDPQAAALELARERFAQVVTEDRASGACYARDMSALPAHVDVVVVATPANSRLAVVSQLLETSEVSYLVLEKVLVQSSGDLDALTKVVGETPTWVNCPRRGNWGIACNSVHFLDLAVFLTGSSVRTIDATGLDPVVRESKRAGFKELTGTLRGELVDGSRIQLEARPEATEVDSMRVRLRDGSFTAKIVESAKQASLSVGSIGGETGQVEVDLRHQSGLTQEVVQSLMRAGDCSLTPLHESVSVHRPFLDALLGVFQRLEPEAGHTRAPIT